MLTKAELYLLLVILKKLLRVEVEKNQKYKKEKEEREQRVQEQARKIDYLTDKEMKLKLLPKIDDRKVPTIHFDLKSLNERVDSVDAALNGILEGNDMQGFIQETAEKNKTLNQKVGNNLKLSKDLSNKMEVIKRALIKLNSQ